jgi:hypothetical protein
MPLNVAATADADSGKMQMRVVARPVSRIKRFYYRATICTVRRHHAGDPSPQREEMRPESHSVNEFLISLHRNGPV